MKITLLIVLSLTMAAIASDTDQDWKTTSLSGDGKFSWVREVPKSVIASAPQWNPDASALPLPPEEAYKKALTAFKALGIGEASFCSMELRVMPGRPTNYEISFLDSRKNSFEILVFLDGTVISPRIEKNEG